MANLARSLDTDLKTMQCGTCGVWHAIPTVMFDTCYREGGFWHCPNGHSRGYSKGSERKRIEALEAELAAEQQRKMAALSRANMAEDIATKAQRALKQQQKRHAAGTCPCCKRTFQQLARHIATKHPEFKP